MSHETINPKLVYGSVCSGIEAATVAWHPLGWKPAWFSEIESFPNEVLAHHYPDVPNLGNMEKLHEHLTPDLPRIDLLVGGTPCQSFSLAGLRRGLDDARGNLCLVFCRLAQQLHPRWIVWENVPGVLSANEGRAFGSFLRALAECGYGFAYRILDAKNFGVPQRRRRVFVVGYFGDWRPAAAVLFEQGSLCWNPTKGEEEEENSTCKSEESIGSCETIAISGDVTPKIVTGLNPTLRSGRQGFICTPEGRIRQLTPIEYERLQGFPPNYTLIPTPPKKKKKKNSKKILPTKKVVMSSDGVRYKALGNSMAVPVMRWIGKRIQEVDSLKEE